MEAKKVKTPEIILPPLPETKRGFTVQISGHNNGKRIAYCNGRFVFIRSLEGPEVTVFSKHLQKVNAATIAPSGTWVASGDAMGNVYVWDCNRPDVTKNEVKACRSVTAICWSFDSKRVCAVGDGNPNRGKVFPYNSGNSCGKVDGHTKKIISCDWNGKRPFRLATSGEDYCVAVYENVPVKYNKDFEGEDHVKFCNAVKYSPDSSMLATCGQDSKIFIYDGKKPDEPLKKMGGLKKGHKGATIYCMAWNADSKRLATGSSDKTIKVWDVTTKKVVKTFTAGKGHHQFFQVGLLWLEKQLLSVSLNGSITLWDYEKEEAKTKICGHNMRVEDIAVSGENLYSVGADSRLTAWDVKTGAGTWFEGDPHKEKAIIAVAALPSGKLATLGNAQSLNIADTKKMAFGESTTKVPGFPQKMVAGNKSELIVITTYDTILIYGEEHDKLIHEEKVDYTASSVEFSPDDKVLAVGDTAGNMHYYDVADGKLSAKAFSTEKHGGEIKAISFSADGKLIATAGSKKRIHITKFEGKGGDPENAFGWEYHQAAITAMEFSPNGKMLATGSMDESFIIWKDLVDFKASERETTTLAHISGLAKLKWMSEELLVTMGRDNCIKTWKI